VNPGEFLARPSGTPTAAQAFETAVLLQQQGRLREAEQIFRNLLKKNRHHFDCLHHLGIICAHQGKFDEAAKLIRRALLQKPNSAEAHSNLGNVLRGLVRNVEAIAHYEKALAIKPDFAEAHNNRGNALRDLHRDQEAVASYERAVALRPDQVEIYSNLGATLRDLGRFDEACLSFEKALALAPRAARFYRYLSDSKRFLAGDRHLVAMEELARDAASLPKLEQMELHFALAKAYADCQQLERSFHHLLAGNALKRQQTAYDESTALGLLERIRTIFTPELMRSKSGGGDPSPVPVFIVGMPRSGTSLIEQILASHPKVFAAGELAELDKTIANLGLPFGAPTAFPDRVASLTAEELRQLGERYLAAIRTMAPDAERITDKMPANFHFAGLIHLALPNARIIHARRDPVDTCLSCFSIVFTGEIPFAYDLGELGRYYRAYQRLMDHWRAVLPERVMLEVQYEDVVDDLEGEARRIVAHCGLEWNDACLAFHKTERAVRTASVAQVRQPIYRSSVGRWRPYAHLLSPLFEALGAGLAHDHH